MDPVVAEHATACSACGTHLKGAFCQQCGEPSVHEGDLRLSHLTHEFVHEFTHLDGKVWRTLWALLFKPGKLTSEYWAGERGRWIRPLRLYLVISALTLLLAASAAGPLGLRVWVKAGTENFFVGSRPDGAGMVDQEMNHRIQSVYLWARYLSLAVFAAASLALYRRRQRYFGAHLIFGLHFYSFEYLLSGVMVKLWPDANAGITIGIGFVYLWFALKRIFQESWVKSFGKAYLLFMAVAIAEAVLVGGCTWVVTKFLPHH